MNSEEFVDAIKEVVRDAAIQDTIEDLGESLDGNTSRKEQLMRRWYASLSEDDKICFELIIRESVDQAIFGMFCVIDGVRTIEDGEDKGKLELYYRKGDKTIFINDPQNEELHNIFNSAG